MKYKLNQYQWLQGALVLAAFATMILMVRLEDHLTIRAIARPTGGFTIPYVTHGGTVFISKAEWMEKASGWVAAIALVMGQLWLNHARRLNRS